MANYPVRFRAWVNKTIFNKIIPGLKKRYMNRMAAAIKNIFMKRSVSFIRYVSLPVTILIVQVPFSRLSINDNQNNYRTVLWNEADGLSLGRKNIMLKKVNGSLRITSPAGLNHFDGSNFKVYYFGHKISVSWGYGYFCTAGASVNFTTLC